MAVARPRHALTSLPTSGRVYEMQRRLERRLQRAGMSQADAASVLKAHAEVVLHRCRVLHDDEHFDALHPSRTLLILLDDCDVADVEVLAAAARVESEHPELRVAAEGLAAAVPIPAETDTLLEDLIVASGDIRLIALAERLDHARHLHLRPRAHWAAFHESACSVYAPVARRTHPRLARRFEWWTRMFARRFLPAARWD